HVRRTRTTTTAIAPFLAPFTNSGAYISAPAENFFEDLNLSPSGYLVGGVGDRFFAAGNLSIASTRSADWDTAMAELHLIGGRSHQLSVPGTDLGAIFEGYDDNFAYGSLTLGVGQTLDLIDADSTVGGAVYVGHFDFPGGLV